MTCWSGTLNSIFILCYSFNQPRADNVENTQQYIIFTRTVLKHFAMMSSTHTAKSSTEYFSSERSPANSSRTAIQTCTMFKSVRDRRLK